MMRSPTYEWAVILYGRYHGWDWEPIAVPQKEIRVVQKREDLLPELRPLHPIIGMTLSEAEVWVISQTTIVRGWAITDVRSVKEDGESMPMFADERPFRINVEVEEGKIVKICGVF